MTDGISPLDVDAQEAANAVVSDATRLERDQECEDIKWLMANKQGRRIMYRLLGITRLFHNEWFPDGRLDFSVGQRNVGTVFWKDICELCPEKYPLMVKEHNDNARRTAKPNARPSGNA